MTVSTLAGPFDLGDLVRLSLSLTDPNGNPRDASTVVLAVRPPTGTVTNPVVVHSGTGTYRADYEPTEEGQYFYRFEAEGSVTAAEEGSFIIRPRVVT